MSLELLVRCSAACLFLPAGGLFLRLALGLAVAAFLSANLPAPTDPPSALRLLAELVFGSAFGLAAAVPAYAARGLRADGPHALAMLGSVLAASLFFAVGGPLFVLVGLGQSAEFWPPSAATPDLGDRSSALFYGPLILGLPFWLTALLLGPGLAALDRLYERVGSPALTPNLLGLGRLLFGVAALVLALPFLIDELRSLWLTTLRSN